MPLWAFSRLKKAISTTKKQIALTDSNIINLFIDLIEPKTNRQIEITEKDHWIFLLF
jgi:hypothetical protein